LRQNQDRLTAASERFWQMLQLLCGGNERLPALRFLERNSRSRRFAWATLPSRLLTRSALSVIWFRDPKVWADVGAERNIKRW